MKYNEILKDLGYSSLNPKAYEIFLNSTYKKDPFLSKENAEDILKLFGFEKEIELLLQKSYCEICQNENANIEIQFLKDVICSKAHPTDWILEDAPHPTMVREGGFQVWSLLACFQESYMDIVRRGVPKDMYQPNMDSFKGFVESFYQKNHTLGIYDYCWNTYYSAFLLFRMGYLTIMLHRFDDSVVILQNELQETIILMKDHTLVNSKGLWDGVDGVHDQNAWYTTYEETEDFYIGYPVSPYGYVLKEKVVLSKKSYHIAVEKGDFMIEMHVPAKKGYSVEAWKDSLQQAKTFFQTYYKEVKVSCIWGRSWLFGPDLEEILPANSHIMEVKHQGYIVPSNCGEHGLFVHVFHNANIDILSLEPKTSLERGIKEYYQKGNHLAEGTFFYMLNDLDQFGEALYIRDYEKKRKAF